MSKCRKFVCGLPIVFALNERSGKRVPLDAVPDEGGRFAVTGRSTEVVRGVTQSVLVGHPLRQDEEPPPGAVLYMADQATCRDRPGRRKRDTKRQPPRPPTLFDPNPEGTTP